MTNLLVHKMCTTKLELHRMKFSDLCMQLSFPCHLGTWLYFTHSDHPVRDILENLPLPEGKCEVGEW